MTKKKDKYTIPEEFKFAPRSVKDSWQKGCELDEKIKDTSFNTIVLADKFGEAMYINCNAVYSQNQIRMRRAGITNPADFKLVEDRSRELKTIQRDKGHCTRTCNGYMTGNKHSSITDWKKQDILEQFGEYKSIDQVGDWLKEQGLTVQRGKLVELFNSHLDDIKDRRLRYIARSRDTALATETGRIEALSYLYTEALKQWEATKNRGYLSEGRAVLEQVRKEVKGDEIKLTVDGRIDFTATIQANRSLGDFIQKIPINLFIVSLVAGKRGVNPNDIMSQLTNSFYSRWNGFGREMAGEEEEIKLPSHFIKNYDWNDIEARHKDKDEAATSMLYHRKLENFFKREGVEFRGNVNEALQMFKKVCSGEAVSEIIDVKPIEVEVIEERKVEINSAKERLKEILAIRRKQLKNNE